MAAHFHERVLSVHHWTDNLFSFTTTRDPSFRFLNGQFTMIGIEVDETVDTNALAAALLGHGILTKETRKRTYRLTPPLTIEEFDLFEAIDRVHLSLTSVGA